MKILTTINDVRKYRQLGKQLNSDNFEGRVREVQENELTELLGNALAYDFFNFLDNGFSEQAGTFTRQSATQFTAVGVDLSSWSSDYSLRINNDVFVKVESATFGSPDTIVIVSGYDLPGELTSVEYSSENKYIGLLNGESYTQDSDVVNFNGLRPFIVWKFLAIFAADGNVKHSDTGNFSITSQNFQPPSRAEINAAKSTYLENSVREENRIIDYLNGKSNVFPLWSTKGNENIVNFDFIVI